MRVIETEIPAVKRVVPNRFGDDRGWFSETFRADILAEAGIDVAFVQDNQSRSRKNVLRGLHYQNPRAQGKLLRVLAGEIFDVAVDIRRGSARFGNWDAVRLSADNRCALWVPPGFAHGFLVISDYAEVLYKTTDYWAPEHEHCILWDDPQLAINWPLDGPPELSAKDQRGKLLKDAEVFA